MTTDKPASLGQERYLHEAITVPDDGALRWAAMTGTITLLAAMSPVFDFAPWLGGASYLIDVVAFGAGALSISLLWLFKHLMDGERDSAKRGADYAGHRSFAFIKDVVGGAAVVVFVALVVTVAISAVTFDLAMHHRVYNPFEQAFSFVEGLVFFADQAAKGALFDVMEVFKLDLQHQLHIDPWRHVLFACLLVGFRMMMSLFAIGGVIALAQAYFYAKATRQR